MRRGNVSFALCHEYFNTILCYENFKVTVLLFSFVASNYPLTWAVTKQTWAVTKQTWAVTKQTWAVTKQTWAVTKQTWAVTKQTWAVTKQTWAVTKQTLIQTLDTDTIVEFVWLIAIQTP